jgi:hypothetical protein
MRVGTGFEVDVKGPALRTVAGLSERLLLGVRLALGPVVTLARDAAFLVQDDGADHRVGARPKIGLRRQLQGASRPMKVGTVPQGTQVSRQLHNRIRSTRISNLLSSFWISFGFGHIFSELKSEL